MGIAVWRVTIKPKNMSIFGHVGFRPEKKSDIQRSSGLVVIRRVARLSRIGARLMFGPPGHATASPRALPGPVGPRRAPGGTVGPRLIGASPVWAARNSYWRQPVLLYQSWPIVLDSQDAPVASNGALAFVRDVFLCQSMLRHAGASQACLGSHLRLQWARHRTQLASLKFYWPSPHSCWPGW